MIGDELRRSGVYAIINLASGKLYVGSAVNIAKRWRQHCSKLSRDIHHSRRLQNAWNKHGADAFAFVVIRFCPVADLISEEQRWIDETEAAGRHGYNIAPTAGSQLGAKRTPEICAKMSEVRKGRKKSAEHRANIGAANRGRKQTPEACANYAKARRGKKQSPEAIAKTSAANRGRKLTQEHRAKISSGNQGRELSPESRAKISAARKGTKQSPETIAKRLATKRANKRARIAMVQGELFT